MAKEFYTEGVNGNQVLHESPTEQIPIYDDYDAAEADLANLEVGQIVATKTESGNEVTNEVEENSTSLITSGGVAKAMYFNPNGTPITILSNGTAISSSGTSYTPTKNGYFIGLFRVGAFSQVDVHINGVIVYSYFASDSTENTTLGDCPIVSFTIPVRKGQTIKVSLGFGNYLWSDGVRFYPEE